MRMLQALGDSSILDPLPKSTDLVNVTKLWSSLTNLQLFTFFTRNFLLPYVPLLILCGGALLLSGCPVDNTDALKQENRQLKKQIAKLESVVFSLQEGNKAIQQQIDLINREARKTQQEYELKLKEKEKQIQNLSQGNKQDNSHLQELEQEIEKLRRDARWLRTLRDKWRKGLTVVKKGGQAKKIDYPFSAIIAATQSTLVQNGYTILASMPTDQQAAFITNRKTSPPASLEVTGFRNQYILTITQLTPPQSSTLWVKADFEKLSQNGLLLDASKLEIKEIEDRLIREIQQTLNKPKQSQKKK